MTSTSFDSLGAFDHFVDNAFEQDHYEKVPSDWLVVVADIDASTAAVFEGQYESVNFVGAACVLVLKQTIDDITVPQVFGGDGASAVIPPEYKAPAESALRALRQWALDKFELHLRIGVVPMTEIEKAGGTLEMGKLRLSPGSELAMLRGPGLDIADQLIKDDDQGKYRVADTIPDAGEQHPPQLDDLSCRWSPIQPAQDLMLCLIFGVPTFSQTPQREADKLYGEIVAAIDEIVGIEESRTNPSHASKLNFKLRWASIVKEVKARNRKRLLGIFRTDYFFVTGFQLFASFIFWRNLKVGGFDPKQYVNEISLNSDYVKVSGMVRLMLDCSQDQADRINSVLESYYRQGTIVYGDFRAPHALMTCVTPDIVNGQHLHYLDGSDGGFWQAAKRLKIRAKQRDGLE